MPWHSVAHCPSGLLSAELEMKPSNTKYGHVKNNNKPSFAKAEGFGQKDSLTLLTRGCAGACPESASFLMFQHSTLPPGELGSPLCLLYVH